MKAIIISAIIFTGIISTASAENPQIRTCRVNHSLFWTLDITSPKDDNIGFCKWGDAMVDSITMMIYYYENRDTMAMNAFFQTKEMTYKSCRSALAKQITGVDSNSKKYKICVFPDYSFIKKSTLLNGWNNRRNSSLVRNL